MRGLIMALALVFGLSLSGTAQAQDTEIKGVITSQIEAFKVDDFAQAFEFASPSIRNIFRTPENFGRMVTQGYPMVWRPSEVTYLQLREISGDLWQMVEIIDGDGTAHYLDYRMQQTSDGWKISGVQLVKGPGVSA